MFSHKKRTIAVRFIIISMTLLAVGCVRPGTPLEPPRIKLAHVKIQEIKLFETVLEVDLRIFNTNDVSLEVKGIDCDLELNGKKIASGVSRVTTTLSPFTSETVPVTMYSSVLDVFRELIESNDNRKLAYKISGKLHVAGGFLLPSRIPFSAEGEIPLEQRLE